MSELIFLIEPADDGGFVAKALGVSIVTQAETFEDLKKNIRDAVRCHFDENAAPHIIRLHTVKDEVMAL